MDIFISYSSKDTDFAKKICAILKNKGHTYWIAYENECFGEQYATTIINEIENCKAVVILVSKNSNESTHVINEINAAIMRNKKLLPIIIEDVTLSPAMEYYLASHHYLYATSADFYAHFTNRLNTLLNNEKNEAPKKTIDNTDEPKVNPLNPQPQPTPVNPQTQQAPYTPQPQQVPYNPQYIPPQNQQKKKEKKWVVPLIIILVVLAVIGAVANSNQKNGNDDTSDTETTRESISIEVETKEDFPTIPNSVTTTEAPAVYQYTKGEIVNNTYINDWANVQFALGDTWTDSSQDQAFANASVDSGTEYGLVVKDSSTQRSVCIGFEKLTGIQSAVTAEQYVDIVAQRTSANFDAQGVANEYSDRFTTEVAGQEYQAVSITLYNTTVTEQLLVKKQGDYIIWFIVYGESPSAVTEILNNFEPIR